MFAFCAAWETLHECEMTANNHPSPDTPRSILRSPDIRRQPSPVCCPRSPHSNISKVCLLASKQCYHPSLAASSISPNHWLKPWLFSSALIDSNMSSTSDDVLVRSLERERLEIWRAHPTEQARQQAWLERKARLLSYLVSDNDASAPRSIPRELDGSSQAVPANRKPSVGRDSLL